jgi:putative nucleotidyltransferase with HDIG domain
MKEGLENRLRDLIRQEADIASRSEWKGIALDSEKHLFNYRYDHVCHVVGLSKHLADLVGADREVVTLAAWLHDISKPGVESVKNHGGKGAERAREILEEEDVESHVINRVCEAIEKHVGLTLNEPVQPLEAQVVWDADKLNKLGIVGIIHFLVNGIKVNPLPTMEEVTETIHEFLPLAERIVSSMNTDAAKELARERMKHLRTFAEMLDKEMTMTKGIM